MDFVHHVSSEFLPEPRHYETEVTPEEDIIDRVGEGIRYRRVQILNAHIVKIVDAKIKASFYFLVVLVLLFFTYQSILEHSLVEFNSISGVLTATVKPPEEERIDTSKLGYCQKSTKISSEAPFFKPEKLKKKKKSKSSKSKVKKHPRRCEIWDQREIVYPSSSTDNTLSITTFARKKVYIRECNRTQTHCNARTLKEIERQDVVVAGVESLELRVDHIVQSKDIHQDTDHSIDDDDSNGLTRSCRRMNGFLMQGDEVLQRLDKSDSADKISLAILLKAASIESLDLKTDGHRKGSKGKTYRERGLVLFVTISYTNMDPNSLFALPSERNIWYTIKVARAPYSEFSHVEPIYISKDFSTYMSESELEASGIWKGPFEGDRAALWKRYAIHLKFIQTGKIGRLSTTNIMVQVVSLLGIVGVVRYWFDILAKYYYRDEISRAAADRANELSKLRNTFSFFDTDGDGMISLTELRKMLHWMGKQVAKDEVIEMVRRIEPNCARGSIAIDFSRFCMLLASLEPKDVGRLVSETEVQYSANRTLREEGRLHERTHTFRRATSSLIPFERPERVPRRQNSHPIAKGDQDFIPAVVASSVEPTFTDRELLCKSRTEEKKFFSDDSPSQGSSQPIFQHPLPVSSIRRRKRRVDQLEDERTSNNQTSRERRRRRQR
ncbi:hypothetical protein AAMO2058_001103900 [Amorphochlora amoebiformis]|uniref:EF-hand domain-containing protein n=1 Tax=Amorphochlora amoebiformis TaxID=1561963 RepID=A0A7S0GWF8_9EUKA|mmetsp:Transcript_17962/g.28597  ORF Transcript_17962/g.28597 Transcript_17962/m.28597 type:complete len:667 (+) Transcript_17962:41-2041(+)